MKTIYLCTVGVALLAMFATASAQAGAKVTICHIPPGNSGNRHTITVSDKDLKTHLAHGDLPGSCEDNGGALCNDGDLCTTDAYDAQTGECVHSNVNCDDMDPCTTDSCDPAQGCIATPIECTGGGPCSVGVCNNGECTYVAKDCGTWSWCLEGSGECADPCAGMTCESVNQCYTPGECVIGSGGPVCTVGYPVADGTACNDGDSGTINDLCTAGKCAGELGVCDPACAPETECREAGVCDASANACLPGAAKNEDETCTVDEAGTAGQCKAGQCVQPGPAPTAACPCFDGTLLRFMGIEGDVVDACSNVASMGCGDDETLAYISMVNGDGARWVAIVGIANASCTYTVGGVVPAYFGAGGSCINHQLMTEEVLRISKGLSAEEAAACRDLILQECDWRGLVY